MGRGNLNDVELMRVASRDVEGFVALGAVSTGPDPERDSVVQLVLADAEGTVLFDQLVRPADSERWPGAKIVRGVHMDEANQAPEAGAFEGELRAILAKASVLVGYDLDLVLRQLEAAGLRLQPAEAFDLKHEYAKAHGRWSEWSKDYTFASLYELASRYGYAADEVHDAAEDARAAAHVYRGFVAECRAVVREQGANPQVAGARRRFVRLAVIAVAILLAVLAVIVACLRT